MNDNHCEPRYIWRSFDELTSAQLYELLKLRQEVFVVEQNCPYLDADGHDQCALHLLVHCGIQEQLIGYLRIIEPGRKCKEPALGRLVTAKTIRGAGVARQMMLEAIALVEQKFSGLGIRISAQLYLQKFYTSLGFNTVSKPYDEDGIPHIEMFYRSRV